MSMVTGTNGAAVTDTHSMVSDYYGQVLKSNRDLKTNACCSAESISPELREIMKQIHPEVLERFYGCGSPIPPLLEGLTVLDLGSGTGRDVFILSKLVGPRGKVIGVDMTAEQIAIAESHIGYHAKQFGLPAPNVEFKRGYIEDLEDLGIADSSVDAVVSNCVINLSPRKDLVFSEILRVLKPGGELYFSDVFADRRIPKELLTDPELVGECLAGAMYTEDFRRLLFSLGCPDYRIFDARPLLVSNESLERKLGPINFISATVRAFKLELEDRCENYGQIARYRGTIPGAPHTFRLDDHHVFECGLPVAVCGNTASMLENTRFGSHFEIIGSRSAHFGLFPCGPSATNAGEQRSKSVACC